MKKLVLLALLAAACGSSSPASSYPACTAHVEPIECMSPTGGVLGKDGHTCASCTGVDQMGHPTAKPVDCTTFAGDLCVADCGECS